MKTSNGKIGRLKLTAQKIPFQANNIFAFKGSENWYTVYSYGTHWPLFHWNGKQWFSNSSKYGVTTSKHFGQAYPHGEECTPLTVNELRAIL